MNYTISYHTYCLLSSKGHIQLINNQSNINVENKETNKRVHKITILHSIPIKHILHYITLTHYFVVKDIFS